MCLVLGILATYYMQVLVYCFMRLHYMCYSGILASWEPGNIIFSLRVLLHVLHQRFHSQLHFVHYRAALLKLDMHAYIVILKDTKTQYIMPFSYQRCHFYIVFQLN